MTEKQSMIRRFTRAQRFEHMLLLVSFIGLAITGLPQRYAETELGIQAIRFLGGIESIRIAHRIFAVALLIGAIIHGGTLTYKFFVLRMPITMLPSWRDAVDVWHWTMYNLGLRKEHPRMPRYNFIEKVEYLAVVWGTIIMAITGFMLWNPIATSKYLPGSYIPIALRAHSAEALLAALSIVIWHWYHVIFKQINPSMFTGMLSRKVYEEEHALELEAIDAGTAPQKPPRETILQRRRYFIPYATLMTVIMVGLLIRFVTLETTAITTVPRVVTQEDLDAPLQVSASDGDAQAGAVLWPELRCGECHGTDARGAEGPLNISLANTSLDFESFVRQVRRGPADMPAVRSSELSDQQLADLYTWLQTLEDPE
jgi:cytochrome b subunit of formate dehydrogenase/cytochrome c553